MVEKIREHRHQILKPFRELEGIGVFPPAAWEIQTWLLGPEPEEWPVSGSRVYQDDNGELTVRLTVKDRDEWPQLQQHYREGSELEIIDQIEKDITDDLTGRRGLFYRTLAYVKDQLGLPVLVEYDWQKADSAEIPIHYVNTFYERVFRQVAGLPIDPISEDRFWRDEAGNFCLDGTPIMLQCDKEQTPKGISLLVRGVEKLANLPETLAVGEAYRRVETTVQEIKKVMHRLVDPTDGPDNSVCEICRYWVAELGTGQ